MIHGLVMNDHLASRAFLYAGLLGLVGFTLIAIAHAGRKPLDGALGPLLSLLSAFVFDASYSIPAAAIASIFGLITLLTVSVGMLNSRGISNRPPLEVLRGEY